MKGSASFKIGVVFAVFAVSATTSVAQTLTILHSFDNTDGAYPSPPVQGLDGNFYGTTVGGGLYCSYGCGTIFRVSPDGAFKSIYSFCSQPGCLDGEGPHGQLIQSPDGNLYGTTSGGGTYNAGAVFTTTSDGALTTLYSFCSEYYCADGEYPSPLQQSPDGDFFGTTRLGGNPVNYAGTVFRITPAGTLTTLYSFCPSGSFYYCPDGYVPYAPPVVSANGDLFGTTVAGGEYCFDQCGTVYKIGSEGTFTAIHSFCAPGDLPFCVGGNFDVSGLVEAGDGSFYGTTYLGGDHNRGTVFRIRQDGVLTTIYSFCSLRGCADGDYPASTLTPAPDGNLYGTTSEVNETGTIFKLTPSGELTTLARVNTSGLSLGTDGRFYGGASGGITGRCGNGGCGVVFSLDVGLGPFIKALPPAGEPGSVVKILGSDLASVTRVEFNGTAAQFRVVSHTLILTTVPDGATSGKIAVAGPGGVLSSDVPFRVK